MTKYREIIRIAGLGLSQTNIALSCNASKTTVNKVLKAAREQNLTWPLDPKLTDPVLCGLLFPNQKAKVTTSKRMPDYAHIRKELLRNGVNKKLLCVFCQVLFPEKSVGIPFFQQGIFPAFSGHYASLRMRACSIR